MSNRITAPAFSSKFYTYFWFFWVALFLPLLVVDYSFAKKFVEAVACICLVYSLVHYRCYKQVLEYKNIDKNRLIAILCIVFFMLVAFLAYQVFPSEYADKKYHREFVTMGTALVLLCSLSPVLDNYQRNSIKNIQQISLMVFVLAASMSIIYKHHIVGIHRPTFIGTNPLVPGSVLAILSVWMLIDSRKKILLCSLVIFIISAYALALNESRGAWLAALAMLSFLIFSRSLQWKANIRFGIYTAFILGVLVFISTPQVQKRFSQASDDIIHYQQDKENLHVESSVGLRFLHWEYALSEITKNPLVMRGVEDANTDLILKKNENNIVIKNYSHMHNEIIQQWYQKGILGFFALLALFCVPYFLLHNYKKSERMVFIIGFIVAGLTDAILYHNLAMLIYLFVPIISYYISQSYKTFSN